MAGIEQPRTEPQRPTEAFRNILQGMVAPALIEADTQPLVTIAYLQQVGFGTDSTDVGLRDDEKLRYHRAVTAFQDAKFQGDMLLARAVVGPKDRKKAETLGGFEVMSFTPEEAIGAQDINALTEQFQKVYLELLDSLRDLLRSKSAAARSEGNK